MNEDYKYIFLQKLVIKESWLDLKINSYNEFIYFSVIIEESFELVFVELI